MHLLFNKELSETRESLYRMDIGELLDLEEEVKIREDILDAYHKELDKKNK